MVKHCPYCGKKQIEKVGISSFGAILKCLLCKSRFIVTDPDPRDI